MSFVDTITKRGPGRPRKNASVTAARSPVAAALAQPVPAGLKKALDAYTEAKLRHQKAVEACEECRGPAGASLKEKALSEARKALMEAQAAIDLDEPDAPDEMGLEKLQAAFDRAKADADNIGARLEALQKLEGERYDAMNAAHSELNRVIGEWKRPSIAAVEEQMLAGAQMIAEGIAAAKALQVYELYAFPKVDLPNYGGGPRIRPEVEVQIPDELAVAIAVARRGFNASRPAVNYSTVQGTLDRR